MIEMDEKIDRHQALSVIEKRVNAGLWRSPSYITSWLPILFIVGWILLFVNACLNR